MSDDDLYVPLNPAHLSDTQRRVSETVLGLRWAGAGEVVRATARYLEYLSEEEDIRLAPGPVALEHAADQLRREAESEMPALRHFGLLEARLDFALSAGSEGPYQVVGPREECRLGDEVLVDGLWLKWTGGEASTHPAWDALRRRPWRRRRDGDT